MEGWTSPDRAPDEDVVVTDAESALVDGERLGRANRLAVTALICATCVPFLLVSGILATVFGMVALDEIEEAEEPERGEGIAKWAIGLGFVNILLSCAAIVLLILLLKN